MKLVFYSLTLNHHQAPVADVLYKELGEDFCFVELLASVDRKGCNDDYSSRPYLLKSWWSKADYEQAMTYAKEADVCVFSGVESLTFEIERLRQGRLSFDMGERILKRGLLNLASPRIVKMVAAYFRYNWRKKPLYKLCCSAFAANDFNKLGMFRGRCFKWGYFTTVGDSDFEEIASRKVPSSIMWCARLLTLKHPELAVELAQNLDLAGYDFTLDIYGDEGVVATHEQVYPRKKLEELINRYNLGSKVFCHGSIPNAEVIKAMQVHDIFLFTSNKLEGWGAVSNESMANGCVLVASDKIGSTGYLIDHGTSGLKFKNCSATSLTREVKGLLDDRAKLSAIQKHAYQLMREQWNPQVAATRLLTLINAIKEGRPTPYASGPCSKA